MSALKHLLVLCVQFNLVTLRDLLLSGLILTDDLLKIVEDLVVLIYQQVPSPLDIDQDLSLGHEALRQSLLVPPLIDDELLVFMRDRVDVSDELLFNVELLL